MLEMPGGRAALVPAAGFCSTRDSDQKMYSPTKVIIDNRELKSYLQGYEMEERLVVIVDTSRWSSQTRNQIETLQQRNELLLEK